MSYIIYSKENCINCVRAKALLTARGIEFEEKMAGVDYDVDYLRGLGVRHLPYIVDSPIPFSWRSHVRVVGGLEELKRELF